MIEITGQEAFTIHAETGETYKISYETSTAVDILNATGGDVYVNSTGIFTTENSVSNYLLLSEGESYNGYRPVIALETVIYIHATAAGNICVTVKGY